MMISDEMTQEQIDTLRAQYHLDKPTMYRYGLYMIGLVQGDLGTSQLSGETVWELYVNRFPRTLEIAIIGLVISVALAIPLGILAAKYAGTILDNIITVISMFGMAMPTFWLALLFLLWFSIDLKWLPAGYDGTWKCYIMPCVTAGLIMAGPTVRQTRSAMLEVKRQDYIRTARSKGLAEIKVTTRHALRNAWIPIITQIGLMISRMIAGSAIVEAVFTWPGVGQMTVHAVSRRDTTLATGCVILTAIMYVVLLMLVDIMYAFVDPRIRAQYAPVRKKRRVAA
jgi:peptide/nickel transport system permease protein